ncbi:MAG: RNA-binding S4 domain-containing protein [Bacteroidales bacterium]|jgi:ribosome-associated heat shock protein Hsp15|nr:RNA-binding S4 domain-containing protein [Bacteroidales bacterium]MDD4702910.1 RNA-binding S4 domain-containing protein [Bacteroidales bacterium]MDX9797963.1 RNA-binding S4 domain-containing protein [Bacteroidales bacterium]
MAVRLDKWLWAVRLYKTRALATDACRLGKVTQNGVIAKASKEVKVGDKFEININQLHREIEVKELLNNRIPAKMVENYMTDLTPKEEYERIEMTRKFAFEKRDRGVGRPTKKERRDIDSFKD